MHCLSPTYVFNIGLKWCMVIVWTLCIDLNVTLMGNPLSGAKGLMWTFCTQVNFMS